MEAGGGWMFPLDEFFRISAFIPSREGWTDGRGGWVGVRSELELPAVRCHVAVLLVVTS